MLSSFFDFISEIGGDFVSTDGKLDPAKLAGITSLLTSPGGFNLAPGFFGSPDQPVGYQGSVPNYTAVRKRVPTTNDPNRRPGSGGRRYFTDMQYATTPKSEPKTLEEAQAAAEEQMQQLSLAQAPKGISSVIPPASAAPASVIPPASASSVINAMPVPTYTMASEFPASVEEVKTMSAGGEVIAQLMANPYFVGGGLGLDAAGLAYLFKSMYGNSKGEGNKSPIAKATGGAINAQDQARKDAAALGITIDEYYALPFSERLGMAKKDIGEVFNPSLGSLLQNPNNVNPDNARSLGTLTTPKPPAPAPAPVPEITQENLPKYRPPASQETTTANRPESLTLEDQMGINQGRMTTYPTGAGIGPEMRNEDFLSQLAGIDPKSKYLPPSSDTTIPSATYQGRGAPPKPPKPKLGDFKGSLNKDNAFRKRQKERREWDKKYGDKYNDDGTLKLDNKNFINELLEKLSLSLGKAPVAATQNMAVGGLAGLKKGKYLNGATDGMADEIPATIDRTQPAALSDGEFVVPADVVSHLGNGNSDAGAEVLTDMMDKVRMARTGTKKQGKEIDPQKFLPKV